MNNESLQYKIFKVVNIVLLTIIAVIMIFPYLNTVAKAFNSGIDTGMGGITVYPRVPTLENFSTILLDKSILSGALISVIRVVMGTLIALVVQFSAAYALTKKGLRGRNAILIFLLIPLYFGGGLMPVYILYTKIHLFNTFWVYILPNCFSIFNMVIIRSFLYTIPESMGESARLDGANEITIMARIIVPLSMPIIATIALWTAVFYWNDWTTTLFFINSKKFYTLSFMLYRILKEASAQADIMQQMMANRGGNGTLTQTITAEAIKAAQVVITTLPIIIVYPFLQKYFIKGVMIGAIKD